MKAWIDAAAARDDIRVFGLSLIERHLRAFALLRPRPTEICIDLGDSAARPPIPARLARRLPLRWTQSPGTAGERLRRYLDDAGNETVLAVAGDALVDPRLYGFMAQREGSWAARAGAERTAILRLEPRDREAVVGDAGSLFEAAEAALRRPGVREVAPEDFPAFIAMLRRSLPFYLFTLADRAARDRCERFLFRSNYKGSTDLLTEYLYPPLVWRLVQPLARARVHPNLVTLLGVAFAFAAVPLFAAGEFAAGLILAYAMSVLDSVDGKLARLTFTDSRLGTFLDHGLDIVHPPLWYLAWAWGLSGGDAGSTVFAAAIGMTVLYILDRLCLMIYRARFKRGLHTHAAIDAFIRRFISRRNINLALFTVGYVAGLGVAAFYLIVLWQAATLAYHAGRTAWILGVERAAPGRPIAGPAGR
ncbi:MAG: CDP-alcohol phosphatidyltransferase family protein [Dongiaceae bacterium]